jgi:hypothetical protein
VSEEKLVTVLRTFLTTKGAYLQARSALEDETEMCEMEIAAYLRGYDDRQPEIDALQVELAAARQEFAEWMDASRTALDTHTALQARVRELEATILDEHSRLAQEEAKPAAVGVVGAVRWGRMDAVDCMAHGTCDSIESAKRRAAASHYNRVVAIVDPKAIVPLASAEVARWWDADGTTWRTRAAAGEVSGTVTPLYPGLAQPEQEGA